MSTKFSAQPCLVGYCSGADRYVSGVVVPDGPSDTGQFVGQGDSGLVVADPAFERDGPLLQPGQGLTGFGELYGPVEHGAGAVNQQHAHVAIPALADAAEEAVVAGAVFPGCQSEPGGEMSAIMEVSGVAGCGIEGGGGQQADAGDGEQALDGIRLAGVLFEMGLDRGGAVLEFMDLVQQGRDGRLNGLRQLFEATACALDGVGGAER